MTDPELLEAAGRALHGEHWVSELARTLGVAERTVRRWLAGQFPIPPGIWPELEALCAERAIALDTVRSRLRSRPRPDPAPTPAPAPASTLNPVRSR